MRLLIHVEDIAEVFARVLLADAPRHSLYNSGGIPVSLGELADIVRGFIPDARITFANEGGREESGNYLVDWSRLAKEFWHRVPGASHPRPRGPQRGAPAGGAPARRRAIGALASLTFGGQERYRRRRTTRSAWAVQAKPEASHATTTESRLTVTSI